MKMKWLCFLFALLALSAVLFSSNLAAWQLMTALWTSRDRKAGAPDALWRMTVRETPIDSIVRAVSLRLSPFVRLELAGEKSLSGAVHDEDSVLASHDAGPCQSGGRQGQRGSGAGGV